MLLCALCGVAAALLLYALLVVLVCCMLLPVVPKLRSIAGLHVLITGGSRGIGLALAVQCARRGASVTIVARDARQLELARQQIRSAARDSSQQVLGFSVDLASCQTADLERVVQEASATSGDVELLVNSCGAATQAPFLQLPEDAFEQQMQCNFLSAVRATRAVLPGMLHRRRGRVVLLSSMAGQLGLFGYSAYAPTKFALRGFAEALQMELSPHNVWLTVVFPPDTDTPGFQLEQLSRPPETAEIGAGSGLFSADQVALAVLDGLCAGASSVSLGVDGLMLGALCAGMSPERVRWKAAVQVLLMGPFRLLSLFYLRRFDAIVRRHALR